MLFTVVFCTYYHCLVLLFSHASLICPSSLFFFFNDTATTEIYTLSLHDALPISRSRSPSSLRYFRTHSTLYGAGLASVRSEEHTSELQSRVDLVCRLLLEKKKKKNQNTITNKQSDISLQTGSA